MARFTCEECGFDLWLPIIGTKGSQLGISHLGLYNDGRFPGRSLLVFDKHEEELTKMNDDDVTAFMFDIQTAGKAIHEATGADRMNYAILGNAVPHVHCHIIPRFFDNDPNPKSTPWSRGDKAWRMPVERYEEIIGNIRSRLRIR